MPEILSAHGSKNDIFVAAITPRDFGSDDGLRAFVRRLCDRSGPFGGDGVYLYDAAPEVPRAWFFNPDGSSAEFCGNGMRCLGRVVLDRRGTDVAVIRSGQTEYTVHRGATTPEGVRQVRLEHPMADFAPPEPVVRGHAELAGVRLPGLDPVLEFTAVTVPNPHLVALVDKYVESDLIAMGERVAARRDLFPAGANLSVLLALGRDEIFVRTFERGAGLTLSCGSGMAASRAVWSRLGRADPERAVVVRNAGGMATVSLRARGGWFPVLEGNATFAYRVDLDPAADPAGWAAAAAAREPYPDEVRAYSALEERNAGRLRAAGIETAPRPLPRPPDGQRAGAHRDAERPAGREHLAVDLPRHVCAGADLDAACLEAFQLPVLATAPGYHPARQARPAGQAGRRQDAHVEQPVIQPGRGQQDEASRQQAGVAHHDASRPPSERRAAVQPDREVPWRQRQVRHAGRRVRHPSQPGLGLRSGRADHRGVEADPGHRGEPDPARARPGRARPARARPGRALPGRVRQGQVDPVVPAVEARVDRWAGPGGHAEGSRGQVRRAERHDGQRDAGARQCLGAGPHGAVTPGREHQGRPGHLGRGRRQAVGRLAGPAEPRFPAALGRRLPAPPHEPRRVAQQRPVDHERGHGHGLSWLVSWPEGRPSPPAGASGMA
ncbi:MAG: diaminopimelate epimerase [Actinobacteria bacterium]|nr:diaminopimelate epimerase [Actinomycetota bacterium]